ncbi:MAG: hypothetical protein N3A69_15490, partial [Leptospiraceae bacterium]|nr:hypothetical protein [Leptospiraceae bacterium]
LGRLIRENEKEMARREEQLKNYKNLHSEFEKEKLLFAITEETEDDEENFSLEELQKQLRKLKDNLNQLKNRKQELLSKLQKITEKDLAEPLFIKEIEQEISSIDNKEKSLEILLESLSNQVIQPVQNFLDNYRDFQTFLSKFNRSISDYRISDLSALKIELEENENLYKDLDKISKIIRVDTNESLFAQVENPEQKEFLKVLERYIEKGRSILFGDLFNLTLNAHYENQKRKEIDLKRGNESQGTIRLIHLILFLLVISFFKDSNPENKLVFFIDEDVMDSSNTSELLRFCKENGFIVIFAAKHTIPGLDKYYFLKKSREHKNKVSVDENNVLWARKK